MNQGYEETKNSFFQETLDKFRNRLFDLYLMPLACRKSLWYMESPWLSFMTAGKIRAIGVFKLSNPSHLKELKNEGLLQPMDYQLKLSWISRKMNCMTYMKENGIIHEAMGTFRNKENQSY